MRGRSIRSNGFSLIDVLVSLAVVAVLVSIMLPSFTRVKEHTSRVVCRSNMRQVGLGLAMYADANRDFLPSSIFMMVGNAAKNQPQNTGILRLSPEEAAGSMSAWDGLGTLFEEQYLEPIKIFYCPSYDAEHEFGNYAMVYDSIPDRVFGNYQYRAVGPKGEIRLTSFVPTSTALLADCLRTRAEFSHRTGSNVLRADLSLFWFADAAGQVESTLPPDESMSTLLVKPIIESAWDKLDKGNAFPPKP
jgi:type II secretory pathway pseudopilin PulG